jgi:hypothetical protein
MIGSEDNHNYEILLETLYVSLYFTIEFCNTVGVFDEKLEKCQKLSGLYTCYSCTLVMLSIIS